MKRALAVCTVLAVLGFSAFGIGTFSGKWEATVKLLPSVGLTKNVLTINYTDFGMTFSGILSLLGGTSDTFTAKVSGALGPFNINGEMKFDFDAADYLSSKLTTSLDFAGLGLGLVVEHYGPAAGPLSPCQTNSEGNLKYTITASVDPISAKIVFVDCCTGTEFDSLLVTLKGLGLCCGISLDVEFSFTKLGFDYLSFSGIEIPLCCGVSLTAGITFTTEGKEPTFGFKFAGIGDACFTIYGDALGTPPNWEGIVIHGYKIKCSLGDCNYFETGTAFDATGREKLGLTAPEFEYIKLGFCGAGCCGGKYTVDISIYFVQSGPLFGINRLGATMSIPIMSNLTVKVEFSNPPATLSVGWVFTF